MSLMKNLKTTEVDVQERDVLGGYQLHDTDVYLATIKMAYVSESKNGALGANFVLDIDGSEYRETVYFTNRKKETFFTNGKGETQALPGFSLLNSITMLTIGVEAAEMDTEERTVKIYDYDAQAEVNTSVDAFTELFGTQIKVAIERQLQDKTEPDNDGKYVPTGETTERNVIVKAFHADKDVTLTEAIAKSDPMFMGKWLAKNKGNIIDRTDKKAGGTPAKAKGMAGAKNDGTAKKSRRDLFADEQK